MGQCCGKSASEPDVNGYGKGVGGPMYHQQRPQEPVIHQPKVPPQHHPLPERRSAPQPSSPSPIKPSPLAPSPKPVHMPDTILGKPYEDVKSYYTLGKEVGRGHFGVTYLCTENSTRLQYACKSISKRKLVTKNDKEDIKRGEGETGACSCDGKRGEGEIGAWVATEREEKQRPEPGLAWVCDGKRGEGETGAWAYDGKRGEGETERYSIARNQRRLWGKKLQKG